MRLAAMAVARRVPTLMVRVLAFALCLLCAAPGVPATACAEDDAARTLATRLLAAPPRERTMLLDGGRAATAAVAAALNDLADAARTRSEYARAETAFRLAAAIAVEAVADAERGRAMNGRADSLFRLTHLDEAAAAADESQRFHGARRDRDGEADAWNTLANVHFYRGAYDAALHANREARTRWETAGNRLGLARGLANAGNIQRALGKLDDAAALYVAALAEFDALGDRQRAGVVSGSVALVHVARGDPVLAAEWIDRAIALHEALGDRGGLAKDLDTLGTVHLMRGAWRAAVAAFSRSLALRRTLGDRYAIAESEHNIGLLHASQGRYEDAIDAYKRGLREARRAGTATPLIPEVLTNVGAAAWRLGQTARARANLLASLRISERGGYPALAAANLQLLGNVALDAGRLNEAKERFAAARRLRTSLKDNGGIAETLTAQARLAIARGDSRAAFDAANRAIDLARTFQHPEILWAAYTVRGRAERAMGDAAAAGASLTAAIDGIERLRREGEPARLALSPFFATRLEPYHELIALTLEQGDAAGALVVAERAKARALADLASLRADRDARAEARADREAEAGAGAAGDNATRAGGSPLERVATRMPDALDAWLPEADATVLEFVVTDRATFVFSIARHGGRARVQAHRVRIERRALESRVQRLRRRLATRDVRFAEDAAALHDLLLRPALAAGPVAPNLIVVPDGALWELPFQALRDAAGRYVLESSAISYAPSLTVLRETMTPRGRSGPATMLAFGKSHFDDQPIDASSAAPLDSLAPLPLPALASPAPLSPLPHAEAQARRIAALYARRGVAYLGAEATEERFKAEARRHRIIHVASHALLDEANPLDSSIILSPTHAHGGSAAPGDDGRLDARELLDLRLDADLVILAACETGRGRVTAGEGLIGTAWSLLGAGARGTIVSQWAVDERAASDLMHGLHRRLAANAGAADHAAALREASLDLLRAERYAHPFYWAPFILVGHRQ